MSYEEFKEVYKTIHLPAHLADAQSFIDQVIFALAAIGEGSADAIIRHLKTLEGDVSINPLIADTRQLLMSLYAQGLISAEKKNNVLVYNLHKLGQRQPHV